MPEHRARSRIEHGFDPRGSRRARGRRTAARPAARQPDHDADDDSTSADHDRHQPLRHRRPRPPRAGRPARPRATSIVARRRLGRGRRAAGAARCAADARRRRPPAAPVARRRRRARRARGSRRTARAASTTRRRSRPRPNCATLPVIDRSVSIVDRRCRRRRRASVTVIVAVGVALPARVAARRVDHDPARRPRRPRRCVAVPLYCAVIGPTLTFTMPRYSSPSTSWSCAPGMHGAMRSMSSSTCHVSSTGTSTRNCRRSPSVSDLPSSRSSVRRSSSVSTSAGVAGAVARRPRPPGARPCSARAPASPCELAGLGPERSRRAAPGCRAAPS